jgi:uncharacterized protein YkwD
LINLFTIPACLLAIMLLAACGTSSMINEMKINTSPEIEQAEPTSECDFNENRITRALAYINMVRSRARICGNISYPAAPPVNWNAKLHSAAQVHSEDMSIYDEIGHQVARNSTLNTRIDDSGYDWKLFSENVAGGPNTPEQAVDAWMASPGHCKNIMNPDFTEVGMACAINAASSYRSYWTLVLAAPASN